MDSMWMFLSFPNGRLDKTGAMLFKDLRLRLFAQGDGRDTLSRRDRSGC